MLTSDVYEKSEQFSSSFATSEILRMLSINFQALLRASSDLLATWAPESLIITGGWVLEDAGESLGGFGKVPKYEVLST